MKIICAYCGNVFDCHPEEYKKRYKEDCLKIRWKETDKEGKVIRLCTCHGCNSQRWKRIERVCNP